VVPLFTYPDALPPDKPAMVAIADNWEADTLNVDLLSVIARLRLPSVAGNDLDATVDMTGIIHDSGPLKLHDENLRIDSITGTPAVANYSVTNSILSINYITPPTPGDTVALHIVYHAPNITDIGDVGYHSTSDIDFSFNEPFGARRWLPIHDTPSDKFQWSVAITPPAGWIAVSNGIRHVEGTIPVATSHPVNAYLAAFTSANFLTWDTTAITAQGTHVALRYYARPAYEPLALPDWLNTPRMIAVFSALYGDYPYPNDGYGMVEAPIMGGGGAMEHLAMSTIGTGILTGDRRNELVYAHELSHQWFGDAVTPMAFKDVWLNEGFANFSEGLYLEGTGDSVGAVEHRSAQANAYFIEARTSLVPLDNPALDNLFSATVYDKGALVLQMTRKRFGDSTFFARLQQYFANNQTHPVTSADFIYAMSDGGLDASATGFLHEWIEEPGHPILQWSAISIPGGARVLLHQIQTAHIFTTGLPLWFQNGNVIVERELMQQAQEFDLPGMSPDSVQLVWHDDALYEVQRIPDTTVRGVVAGATVTSYPNPGHGQVKVKISLSIPGVSDGNLKLYDILGRQVYATRLAKLGTGQRLVVPVLPHLAAGTYFWKLDAGKATTVKQIVIE